MKKSLFYSVAIAAAMASCTQEAIEVPSNNVQQDLSIRPTLGEIVLVEDAQVASRFAVGSGAQPVFGEGDKLGAAIMDVPNYPANPYNEKNPAANYTIVEYYSSNSAFTYDGSAWYLNEDQPLVEGNYMFYAPYNAAMQFRSAFDVAVPAKQDASTEKAALDEFYASGAVVRVGAQFLAAEGGKAQKPKVTMNDVFAYPMFTIKNNFSGYLNPLVSGAPATHTNAAALTTWSGDLVVDSIQFVLNADNSAEYPVALKGKLSNSRAAAEMSGDWAETPFENYTSELLADGATFAGKDDVITTLVAGGRVIKKGESAVFYAVMPAARYDVNNLSANIFVTVNNKPYVFKKAKFYATAQGTTPQSYKYSMKDDSKYLHYKTTANGYVTLIKGQRYPQEELNFENGKLSAKTKIAGNALTLDIKGGTYAASESAATKDIEYLQEIPVQQGNDDQPDPETELIDNNAEFIAYIKDLENGTNYVEGTRYPYDVTGNDIFDFSVDNTVVINSELVEAMSQYNHKGSISIATTFPIANDVTVAFKSANVVTFTSENGVSYDLTLDATNYTVDNNAVIAKGKSAHVINSWTAENTISENVVVYEGATVTINAIDFETASFINNGTLKVNGSNVINAVTNNGTIELVDPQYLVVDEGNGVIKATAEQGDVDNLNNVEVIGGTQTGLYIVDYFTANNVAEAEEITWVTDLKVNNGDVTFSEEILDEFVDIATLHITGATFPVIGTLDLNGLTLCMEGTSDMTISGKTLKQTTVDNVVIYNATTNQINLEKIDANGTYSKIENGGELVTKSTATWNDAAHGVDAKKYLTEALTDEDVTEIILPSSVSLTAPLTINRDVTIDLNGKTIQAANGQHGILVENGKLTITGNGTIQASTGDAKVAVWAKANAEVVIENGTFIGSADSNSKSNDIIYVNNGGKITINGGTFKSEYDYDSTAGGVVINAHNSTDGLITVNAGTFVAATAGGVYEEQDVIAGKIVWGGTMTVSADNKTVTVK